MTALHTVTRILTTQWGAKAPATAMRESVARDFASFDEAENAYREEVETADRESLSFPDTISVFVHNYGDLVPFLSWTRVGDK